MPFGEFKLSEAEVFVMLSVDVELYSLSLGITTEVLLLVEDDALLMLFKLFPSDALVLPLKLSDVEIFSLELKEVETDSLEVSDTDSLILIDIDCELLSDADWSSGCGVTAEVLSEIEVLAL